MSTSIRNFDIRLVVVMVFYGIIVIAARKRWVNSRELAALGVTIVVVAIGLLAQPIFTVLKQSGQHDVTAVLTGVVMVVFILTLGGTMLVMARRLAKEPPPIRPAAKPAHKALSKAAAKAARAADPNAPRPKPVRAKGNRRRF